MSPLMSRFAYHVNQAMIATGMMKNTPTMAKSKSCKRLTLQARHVACNSRAGLPP